MANKSKKQRGQSTVRPQPVAGQAATIADDTVLLEQAPMIPLPQDALARIKEIERLRQSRVVTLFAYSDVLLRGDIPLQLYSQLRYIGRVPRIDLVLHSSGGESEVPWRIITLVRNFCDHFSVLIPYVAHSAATHIAMGADEIVMGDMSELSPTDPFRSHPLLPHGANDQPMQISVQDLRQCIEFLKKEGGAYTPESLATIYTALFHHVHPLALGAIEQAYALARLISEQALSTHMDPVSQKEQIGRIVDAFSDGFRSHRYRIGWQEARDLGLPVTYDNGELWEKLWGLYEHYAAFETLARPIDGNTRHLGRQIVWIDSTSHRQILEEQFAVVEDREQPQMQRKQPIASCWLRADWGEASTGEETVSADQAGHEQG